MSIKNQIIEISKKHLLKNFFGGVSRIVLEHKGTVLTGSTIVCNALGIAVAYRNSPKIHAIIEQYHRNVSCLDKNMELYEQYKKQYLKEALAAIAPLIAPIIFFFAGSTVSAIVNQKQNEAKIATLTAALSLAQSTISEYDLFKEEAKKELGEEKFQQIESEVAKRRVDETPIERIESVKVGVDEWLCCIPDLNIFFSGTKERMELAMDRVNGVLMSNGRDGRSYGHTTHGDEIVQLSDILYELNDPQIEIPAIAEKIQWDAGKTNYISYRIDSGHTRSGTPFLTLIVDLSGSNLDNN